MEEAATKQRAPRNRTLALRGDDILALKKRLIKLNKPVSPGEIENKTIHQDIFEALEYLPNCFVDLVFVDPPYNLNKTFNLTSFKAMESEKYEEWLDSWVQKIIRLLKPHASIYICGDWKSSGAILNVAKKYFQIQNRITFEREKGRGAKSNWKNCSEDIWFCTLSDDYHFDVVFDPFLGSGTTSVVAHKLGRKYVGIDIDELYCCLAEKRLENARQNKIIQGYSDGVFWERNTLNEQMNGNGKKDQEKSGNLFNSKLL